MHARPRRHLGAAVLASAAAAALVLPGIARAQFQRLEDAVKYRQSAMFLQTTHLGRIGAMVGGRVPYDAKAVEANADALLAVTRLPFAAFVEGSDKIGNTRAKPEIWAEKDRFIAAATRMQDDTTRLHAAAKAGNAEQVKLAFNTLAQACKACHDSYRRD